MAGVPFESVKEKIDGVSLVPFFENPLQLSFPTTVQQGTLNKTMAFSQYPHSDNGASTPATECPFFDQKEDTCRSNPTDALRIGLVDKNKTSKIGDTLHGYHIMEHELIGMLKQIRQHQ